MNLSSRNRGLTLVELLVVIGITAALVAMLLPMLRSMRKEAAGSVCVANLRQIHQIAALWALDNDGYVPQGKWYAEDLSPEYSNLTQYGLTKKLMVCPAVELSAPTYGINSRLVISDPKWGPRDVHYWSHGKYKLALLSPKAVFFSETSRQLWSGQAGAYIAAKEYASTSHFGKGNVLFADGHVEALGPDDLKADSLWTNGIP